MNNTSILNGLRCKAMDIDYFWYMKDMTDTLQDLYQLANEIKYLQTIGKVSKSLTLNDLID